MNASLFYRKYGLEENFATLASDHLIEGKTGFTVAC